MTNDRLKLSAKGASRRPDAQGFAKGLQALKRAVRDSKKAGGGGKSSRPGRGAAVPKASASLQRVSVRVTYTKNKGDGQWAAHGKYIERESASLEASLDQGQELALEAEQSINPQEIDHEHGERPGEQLDAGTPPDRYGDADDRARIGRAAALHQPYPPAVDRERTPGHIDSVRGLSGIPVAPLGRVGPEVLLPATPRLRVGAGQRGVDSGVRRLPEGGGPAPNGPGRQGLGRAAGFGSDGDAVHIGATLGAWQAAGDQNLFKLIVSPEFGERMDMQAHTKRLVAQMERDLGTRLQWVAVEHFNTEHPHVHLAIRGIDEHGQPLRIGKEYIKTGMRTRAQQLATQQLGYRTPEDMRLAAERQVVQQRFTDIDRALQRKAQAADKGLKLDYSDGPPKSPFVREARLREIRRLQQLVAMGLAKKTGPLTWQVNPSFEQALRQIQISNDRLKSLAEQREVLSDPRIPLQATDLQKIRRLAGRVIGTGLDEAKGAPYLLLEGTDAKLHYLYHDDSIQRARAAGQLKTGHFVELERRFVEGPDGRKRAQTIVADKGHADALLSDQKHLAQVAIRDTLRMQALPTESNLGGWLGRYHAAVAKKARDLVQVGQLEPTQTGFEHRPKRARSISRS
jgi:type IV secretory pathway VirD2 relaxase